MLSLLPRQVLINRCISWTTVSQMLLRRRMLTSTGLCRQLYHQAIPSLSCYVKRWHSQSTPLLSKNKVTIHFIDRHGKIHKAQATVGDSLLEVVLDNDLNFETYGVCEGTISCSTCHVILDENTYSELEEPLMDEMDMLDLACGLTETSRLGCQVHVTKEMEGMTVTLPKEITDAREI